MIVVCWLIKSWFSMIEISWQNFKFLSFSVFIINVTAFINYDNINEYKNTKPSKISETKKDSPDSICCNANQHNFCYDPNAPIPCIPGTYSYSTGNQQGCVVIIGNLNRSRWNKINFLKIQNWWIFDKIFWRFRQGYGLLISNLISQPW